jgi:hypothetical protein
VDPRDPRRRCSGIVAAGAPGRERNPTPWFSVSGAVGGFLNATNSFKAIQIATNANLAANLYWK